MKMNLLEAFILAQARTEGRYQDEFIKRLKAMFPKGIILYHRTEYSNLRSIKKQGILASTHSEEDVVYTTLGKQDGNRAGGNLLIQITVPLKYAANLYPEEATYWDESLAEEESKDWLFKSYMQAHPDLLGGDITIAGDIPPQWITGMKKD